ncbi:hypothetical protein ABBQ38_000775 [Trebouxia sp. C0009 RCD-2024]
MDDKHKRSPEATIMNAFKAFIVASTAVAATPLDCEDADGGPDVTSQFRDDAVVAPWYHQPSTFNTDTFELQLPNFTKVHESTPIELRDGQRIHLSQAAVGPQADWLAELHLLYLTFPELCRKRLSSDAAACTHPDCAGLWKQFKQDTAAGDPE